MTAPNVDQITLGDHNKHDHVDKVRNGLYHGWGAFSLVSGNKDVSEF